MSDYRPQLSHSGRQPTHAVSAVNEFGETVATTLPGELSLTVHLEDTEIVTLMTLGTRPEELALGYVRNQRLLEHIEQVAAVEVDWARQSVHVSTHSERVLADWREKLFKRIVTSGCGQGTIYASTLEALAHTRLPVPALRQSALYALLKNVAVLDSIYKAAGAVHGCALCAGEQVLVHVEDVGRHNAADAIAGRMWLDGIDGGDKLFYTTGRLTSEMVMKAAFMGVPAVLSRSGITQMGLALARELGITLIARAKGRQLLIFNGAETVALDAPPVRRAGDPRAR